MSATISKSNIRAYEDKGVQLKQYHGYKDSILRENAHSTVLVTIKYPETKKRHKLPPLFDNGSNESYIAEYAECCTSLPLSNFRNVPVSVFLKDQPVNLLTATSSFLLTNGATFEEPLLSTL